MTIGIVVFPGSNCDRDLRWALEGCLGQPTRFLWHEERDLKGVEAVLLPGGFSYGDYLRCGAIARFAPILQEVSRFASYGEGSTIVLPIAHGEGRYQVDPPTLRRLEDQGQVVLRYRHNPNGSVGDVAGLCNERGNVLGLMPHPERACDPALGNLDGRPLLASLGQD